ncbi:uncharacterized protein LOC120330872 [Styela clava]
MANKVCNAAVILAVISIYICIQEVNARARFSKTSEVKQVSTKLNTLNENEKSSIGRYNVLIQRSKTRSKRRYRQNKVKTRRHARSINRKFISQPEVSDMSREEKRYRTTEAAPQFSEMVPLEIIAQFGGNVPPEIAEQYSAWTTRQRDVNIQSNRDYNEITSEIVTEYSGDVQQKEATEVLVPLPGTPVQAGIEIRAPGFISTQQVSDLPQVSFGEFNYNYDLKPPSVCVHQDNDTDSDGDEEVEKTTAAPRPPAPPSPHIPLTSHQKESLLREHNKYRASLVPNAADMRLLSWDDELAWVSELFTNSCYFHDIVEPPLSNANDTRFLSTVQLRRHSYITAEIGYTWFAWPNTYDIPEDFAAASLAAWVSERDFYNSHTKVCDGICEHYLQIIWAETFKLGCGASWCEEPRINGIIWPQAIMLVCSYTPRGALANYMASNSGFKYFDPKLFVEPYIPGRPCSLCVLDPQDPNQNVDDMRSTTDKCWNGLCTNPVRDKLIPFVPPARTTTQMWIQTPAPTTSSPVKKSTTDVIEIQMDDDDDIVVTEDGSPTLFVSFILICISYAFSLYETFS